MAYPKLTPITATGGSAARYLGDRFADMVNVKDFGAKGDGTTDDTMAFTAAASTGHSVFVPAGSYKLNQHVEGRFFGSQDVSLSLPLNFYTLENNYNRIAYAFFGGSFLFTQPYDNENDVVTWGRAIQGACYDKFDDILYCSAAYAHQGSFLYAFDYKTKNLLGSNYDESVTGRGAFYNKIAHQGLFLYRPSKNDEPLFFTTAPRYTAPDTIDVNNTNKLRLVKWDYTNPTTCTIIKEWTIFDTAVFTPATCCLSEDGTTLCVAGTRVSDGVVVFGVWEVSDIINATGSIYSLAKRFVDSPWGTLPLIGQNFVCDSENIYCLSSSAGEGEPHYIKALDIFSGTKKLERSPSYEGYEQPGATGSEGEVVCFLPVNSRLHLCLATTLFFGQNPSKNVFYDLEAPNSFISDYFNIPNVYAGTTQTSEDLKDISYGTFYVPSGNMTDLSGGGWFLEFFGQDSGYLSRQIAYRGNSNTDIRTRNKNGTWSDWKSFVLEDFSGILTISGKQVGNEKSTNERSCILLQANRDDPEKSGMYIERYCQNSAQANFGGGSFLSVSSLINNNRTYVFSAGVNYTNGAATEGFIYPDVDNFVRIGGGSLRFSVVYAVTGSINTSDERLKSNIANPVDSLLKAWGKVEYKTFQFNDAVEKKGEDARIHLGVIAQDVARVFASEGLDAGRYGLFCYDQWEDEYDELDDGTKVKIKDGGDRYSIRYEEALVLECAYLRSRISKMQEQVDILVERVNQLTNNTNN